MRSLPLILAAVLVLLAADVAAAAPSQAPNQNGGSGPAPNAAPNQNGGSGQLPASPTATPRATPVQTATPTPTPSAAPAPDGPLAPAAPARTNPKKRRPSEALPVTVKRLRGCLPDVTRREARVVVLRGGLGRAKPTSRARIAKALGLSVSGVARAERSGLRRLRSRARASNCESNEDASASAVRDAVAALAAGKGSDREGSGTATTADPERPAAATTSSDDRAHIWFLLALLGGALGVVLIARGVVKEARS